MANRGKENEKQQDGASQTGHEERFRQRFEAFVPDMLRRTFYSGLGALFASEEGIRKLANEFSLPKEVVRNLISQAQTTKDEAFRIVASEVRTFLQGVNIADELKRLLTSVSFEVKTEIRFVPNEKRSPSRSKGKRPTVSKK